MSKFKIGDRVAVYSEYRKVGTVTEISDHLVKINFVTENHTFWRWFHVKQCRRLVKKPRRRIWVLNGDLGHLYMTITSTVVKASQIQQSEEYYTEFVEVRRKK